MGYIAAVQAFVDSNFETPKEGLKWVKRVVKGDIQIDEQEQRVINLRSILSVNEQNFQTHLHEPLREYIQFRKSLPTLAITRDNVEIPCPRKFFSKEAKKLLNINGQLILSKVNSEDLLTAVKIYTEDLPIDFAYFRRNYTWLIRLTTLTRKLYDVWTENIKSSKDDMTLVRCCLSKFVSQKVFTPAGLIIFKKALHIVRSLKINIEGTIVGIECGNIGKRTLSSLRKCINCFCNFSLLIKHQFDANPCERFQKLLQEIRKGRSVESFFLDYPLQNNEDKKALLNLIKSSEGIQSLEISVVTYTEKDAIELLDALNKSVDLENFSCDANIAKLISEDTKKGLLMQDFCFIFYFMQILKELSEHSRDIAAFYKELCELHPSEVRKGMINFWAIFNRLVTADQLRRSEGALGFYRELLKEFPIFIVPYKFYYVNFPRVSVTSGSDPSQKEDNATVTFNYNPPLKDVIPVIVDSRLAGAYSYKWVNGTIALDSDFSDYFNAIIAFIKNGKLEIDNLYNANEIYDIAKNEMMVRVVEKTEEYILEELKSNRTLGGLYAAFLEIQTLENKSFSNILRKGIPLKIKGINLKASVNSHSKTFRVFLHLKTFDKKIIKQIHELIEWGGLAGLSISNLDKEGWKKLKGFLIHYPNVDLKMKVPLKALTYDRRHMPQKHMDAMFQRFRQRYALLLARTIGKQYVIHS